MSDATRFEGDGPTAGGEGTRPEAGLSGTAVGAPRFGFCQDCGTPLTAESRRVVGTGVFCEPCLAARIGAVPGPDAVAGASDAAGAPPTAWGAGAAGSGFGSGPGYVPGMAPGFVPGMAPGFVPPAGTPPPGAPSPVLAGILGVIPGVGAMYNGQFAKGVAHLVIFVLLDVLADDVSGIFWIFVWGWVFYQIFEAYHTANARLEGRPLPNPFGLNDIGERLGFGRNWPGGSGNWGASRSGGTERAYDDAKSTPTGTAYGEGFASGGTSSSPPFSPTATGQPIPGGPPTHGPDWVGYVPPAHFAPDPSQAPYAAGAYGYVPRQGYAETYTGAVPPPATVPAAVEMVPVPRRFPAGALWLIVLGVVILIANLLPDWRLTSRWWPPLFLAGLAVWIFAKRVAMGRSIFAILRAPLILLTIAIMLALQAAHVVIHFGLFCAILFIFFGGFMLLERILGAGPPVYVPAGAYVPPPPGTTSTDPQRASFVATSGAANDGPQTGAPDETGARRS
jgi:hypothetical protein